MNPPLGVEPVVSEAIGKLAAAIERLAIAMERLEPADEKKAREAKESFERRSKLIELSAEFGVWAKNNGLSNRGVGVVTGDDICSLDEITESRLRQARNCGDKMTAEIMAWAEKVRKQSR
ncbi:MAG: hypothetical protein ACKOWW_02955 [Flavobacteriales bacterium]